MREPQLRDFGSCFSRRWKSGFGHQAMPFKLFAPTASEVLNGSYRRRRFQMISTACNKVRTTSTEGTLFPPPPFALSESKAKTAVFAIQTDKLALQPEIEQPAQGLEDDHLLELVAGGRRDAFWTLWQRHSPYLFTICLKRTSGIREDAEDVLSRAMLRAWDKLPSQAWKIENARAWLARLTINLCVDSYREKKRRSLGVDNIDEVLQAEESLELNVGQSPEQEVLRQELNLQLREALGALPPHVQSPFMLHFIHELPCREVGERLSLTQENVRKRIQRARSLLKKSLAAYAHS